MALSTGSSSRTGRLGHVAIGRALAPSPLIPPSLANFLGTEAEQSLLLFGGEMSAH